MGSDQIIVNADGPQRLKRPLGQLVLVAVISVSVVTVCAMLLLLFSTTANDRRLFLIGAGILALATGAVGVYWLFNRAQRSRIVYLPNQHPMTLRQVERQTYVFAGDSLARHYEVQQAEASREYPALTNLQQNYQPQHTETHTTAPALPAPGEAAAGDVPLVVQPDEWLGWVNAEPHVILAAKTGSGKSLTAQVILAPRIASTETEWVFAIDPHGSEWFDLPVVGSRLNWREIEQAVEAVALLYNERMKQRDEYRIQHGKTPPPSHWPRLTVLLDEANEVRDNIDEGRWKFFAKTLGSGARKVNISVILLMQSANVEALGLDSSLRENFTCIALDTNSIVRMLRREEGDSERRKLLTQAMAGRSYPATASRENIVYIFDRTGLDKRPIPTTAQAAMWPGWEAYKALQPMKQQLPSMQTVITPAAPPTTAERILRLLQGQPNQSLSDIADVITDVKRGSVNNELTALHRAGRVVRTGSTGKFRYSLP